MKALILGLKGMLGHQVYKKFKESDLFSFVKGTVREGRGGKSSLFKEQDVYYDVDFNLDGFDRLSEIIRDYKPDIVVNCVVIKEEGSDWEKFLLINSFLPHFVARIIPENSKMIQISTDGIFSGKKGNYSEEDHPDPESKYGKSKFWGEISYKNNITIRASIFGHELSQKGVGLVEWFLNSKENITGFSNYYFSGVSTNYLAYIIIELIKSNFSGVINVCSERISKYKFLRTLNEVYSCKKEISESFGKTIDRSLDPKKMTRILKINPPGIKEMMKQMEKERTL